MYNCIEYRAHDYKLLIRKRFPFFLQSDSHRTIMLFAIDRSVFSKTICINIYRLRGICVGCPESRALSPSNRFRFQTFMFSGGSEKVHNLWCTEYFKLVSNRYLIKLLRKAIFIEIPASLEDY